MRMGVFLSHPRPMGLRTTQLHVTPGLYTMVSFLFIGPSDAELQAQGRRQITGPAVELRDDIAHAGEHGDLRAGALFWVTERHLRAPPGGESTAG